MVDDPAREKNGQTVGCPTQAHKTLHLILLLDVHAVGRHVENTQILELVGSFLNKQNSLGIRFLMMLLLLIKQFKMD